jgi:hypothetical protein
MTMPPGQQEDAFERALSKRLAGLSAMPVDTTAFDKALRAQLPVPEAEAVMRPAWGWRRAVRPAMAVAASLIVVALVALSLQNQTVQAVPADAMVQMHRDIVAHKVDTIEVDSIEKANVAIAAFGGEKMPRMAAEPESHQMLCCMRSVGDKKVSCVLLKSEGVPVTLAVARAHMEPSAGSKRVEQKGQVYDVQTMGELTMVMFERGGQHVCMIGALPESKLVGLCEGLTF